VRDKERESTSRGREREKPTPPTEQGARHGAQSQDPEIMTQTEGRHLTD